MGINRSEKIIIYVAVLLAVAVVYVVHNMKVPLPAMAPSPLPSEKGIEGLPYVIVQQPSFDFASAVGLPVALYFAKKLLDIIFYYLEKFLDKKLDTK